MIIEGIIRKHMEAMHDELLFWLRGGPWYRVCSTLHGVIPVEVAEDQLLGVPA